MELHIIPKQEYIPPFDSHAIKIQHIQYFDPPYKKYEGEEITEKIIAEVLQKISDGINIYLSLDPDGEDNWLEVNCDSEWIALGFSRDFGQNNYYSYNSAFADTADQISKADFSDKSIYTDLESGGQSPIPKIQAITDIETGIKAVEYFIRTGELYPGIDWLKEKIMELHIIPKQEYIPPFDSHAIKIQHIRYFDPPYKKYEGEEITEKIIAEVLQKISDGINIYLSLGPDGEDNWLEVNCDSEWIALGFSGDFGQNNYYSYNSAFADTADQISKADFSDKSIYTDLESGGQSPIPKIQAITDIETGIKAVEYFIRTGELYPGIDWLHE